MPETKRAYDLFVLIDPEVPDERRTGMVEEIRKRISAGDGALRGDVEWGTRRLAYEINHRSDAYYHLFQFEGPAALLETLNRTLAIEDGVLRHRILRLPKGAPDEPPKPPPARQPEPTREGRHGRRQATAPSGEESATPHEEGESGPPAPGADDSAPPDAESPATTAAPVQDEPQAPRSDGSGSSA